VCIYIIIVYNCVYYCDTRTGRKFNLDIAGRRHVIELDKRRIFFLIPIWMEKILSFYLEHAYGIRSLVFFMTSKNPFILYGLSYIVYRTPLRGHTSGAVRFRVRQVGVTIIHNYNIIIHNNRHSYTEYTH
jgi:hypothetical protein